MERRVFAGMLAGLAVSPLLPLWGRTEKRLPITASMRGLWEVSVDGTPRTVWADEDGEVLALVYPWQSVDVRRIGGC
jgi:hypothetical protein